MLQALVAYAARQRLVEATDSVVGPVDAVLRIDGRGRCISVEALRDTSSGKPRRVERRIPAPPCAARTSVLAYYLVDKAQYVLGIRDPKKPADQAQTLADRSFAAYRQLVAEAQAGVRDEGLEALALFLDSPDEVAVARRRLLDALDDAEPNPAHVLIPYLDSDVDRPMHERPALADFWRARLAALSAAAPRGRCLVTGRVESVARLHGAVKGAGTDAAPLVSFNCPAHESQGLGQGANAPVGESAARAYVAALNSLLARSPQGRIQSGVRHGDAITVFWTADHEPMTSVLAAWFSADAESAKLAAESPWTGVRPSRPDTQFHALTLSLNVARIVVRGWFTATAGEVFDAVGRWFDDLALAGAEGSSALLFLLSSLEAAPGAQGDKRGLPPDLAGRLFRCVLADAPLPRTVLATAVERLRVPPGERGDPLAQRVALIKACLRREQRALRLSHLPEITVALDETNTHPAYVLGRLFAVLEKLQLIAAGRERDLNATIRDRYFGAACRTPGVVFPRLLQLSVHHAAKLDSPWLERRKGEIIGLLGAGFPPTLTLEEQGLFAVGYYHEREAFFAKKQEAPAVPAGQEDADS